MIAPSTGFWKAFFDPAHPSHGKARSDLLIYDRERIVLSPFVLSETVSWLLGLGKRRHAAWLLDYSRETSNVRVFVFGKEELADVFRISAEEGLPLGKASTEHMRRRLNCDVTGY